MSSAALRQRAYRARIKDGLVRVTITLPEVEFTETLKATAILPQDADPDRADLARIVEDFIGHWIVTAGGA
jgi:hypothetical protein